MRFKDIFDKIDGDYQQVTEKVLIQFQDEWNLPLSDVEINELRKNDNQPSYWNREIYGKWEPKKFENWTFPNGRFPQEFIRLMKYYGGCNFLKGDREFCVFGIEELRAMNIAYELPEYIEGAVSIGLDGAGNHVIFDMRQVKTMHHYKIYGVHSSNLDWGSAKLLANNFLEFLNGTQNIDKIVNG